MKKNFRSIVKSAMAVALISLSMFSGPVAAQDVLSLNRSDYATPAWTRLLSVLEELTPATTPYSINMTINGDPMSRMAFSWFTNPSVTSGEVQIVAKANAGADDFSLPTMTIDAVSVEVKDLNYAVSKNELPGVTANTKRSYTSHKALATGLMPGTVYSFRVGNEDGWSEVGSFTTAASQFNAEEGYSFVYITDTQARTAEMFDVSQKTIHTAQKKVPDAKFFLCNGDFVDTSGSKNSEWEWEQWFGTMQDVWMNYPLVVAQGNHDTSSNNNFSWHFNTDRSFNQTSSVKTRMEGTVYSFVYGDALFMVVNYEDYDRTGYLAALSAWMEDQVKAHPATKWRIATFHKNMFTGSSSHQNSVSGRTVRETMLPVFEKLDIDLALQGHDHIYEVIGPVNNATKTLLEGAVEHVETVVPGGVRENMTGKTGGTFNVNGGTLYFLNNSAGRKKYEPRNEQEMIAAYGNHGVENFWGLFSGKFGQTGEPTFSKVTVTKDSVRITTYTVNDEGIPTAFDSFKVIKEDKVPSGLISDAAREVKIYNDNRNKQIVIEGMEPESVEVYTAGNGNRIAVANTKYIDTTGLSKGVYVVKVTKQKDSYYGKVVVN